MHSKRKSTIMRVQYTLHPLYQLPKQQKLQRDLIKTPPRKENLRSPKVPRGRKRRPPKRKSVKRRKKRLFRRTYRNLVILKQQRVQKKKTKKRRNLLSLCRNQMADLIRSKKVGSFVILMVIILNQVKTATRKMTEITKQTHYV